MARLTWDGTGEKIYSLGVQNGVLYRLTKGVYDKAEAWNGLTSVTESPSGADEQKFYADNILYGSLRGAEDFGGTIECYTYPDSFAECNGELELVPGVKANQQPRKPFGLSYRTELGNDEDGMSYGYEIHLVYNATVSPSELQYQTINDSPEAGTMSFEFACNPVRNAFGKPMSHIVINSTKVDPEKLKKFEDILYGTDGTEGGGSGAATTAKLPLPDEVAAAFKS